MKKGAKYSDKRYTKVRVVIPFSGGKVLFFHPYVWARPRYIVDKSCGDSVKILGVLFGPVTVLM